LKAEPTSDEDRLSFAFRLCTGRQPVERELNVLKRLLNQQREGLGKEPQQARALVPANLPKAADVVEYAAWTATARVLLNLDEFITRE